MKVTTLVRFVQNDSLSDDQPPNSGWNSKAQLENIIQMYLNLTRRKIFSCLFFRCHFFLLTDDMRDDSPQTDTLPKLGNLKKLADCQWLKIRQHFFVNSANTFLQRSVYHNCHTRKQSDWAKCKIHPRHKRKQQIVQMTALYFSCIFYFCS